MSAKGQEDPGEDLASRVGAESPCSDMKRAAAKKLIERYFYQLTDGCGNPQCDNQYCASSGKVTNLTPNQAAALAIQLFSQEARLCDRTQPSKVARTSREPGPASLAKPRLPVKSMNPTCSIEGTDEKFINNEKSSNHEIVLYRAQDDTADSTRVEFTKSDPLSRGNTEINKNRSVIVTRRSNIAIENNDNNNNNNNNNNECESTRLRREKKLVTKRSRDYPKIAEKTIISRITKSNDAGKKRNERSTNYRRMAVSGEQKRLESGRNARKIDRDKSVYRRRASRSSRDSQNFVRELLVLALYLRYLEAKRYSRNRDRGNNFSFSP